MKKVILLTVFLAFTSISFANVEDTVRHPIPASYLKEIPQHGTTVLHKFNCGGHLKNAVIYLPYGYNKADINIRYNVLFLQHGGGGSYGSYLGPAACPNILCKIVDSMIYNKDIEPVIMVAAGDCANPAADYRNYIIPQLDAAYNTKAT